MLTPAFNRWSHFDQRRRRKCPRSDIDANFAGGTRTESSICFGARKSVVKLRFAYALLSQRRSHLRSAAVCGFQQQFTARNGAMLFNMIQFHTAKRPTVDQSKASLMFLWSPSGREQMGYRICARAANCMRSAASIASQVSDKKHRHSVASGLL